jgi:hypothetical protein
MPAKRIYTRPTTVCPDENNKVRLPRNRHPADELAEVRAEIGRLELREEELRQWLIAHL